MSGVPQKTDLGSRLQRLEKAVYELQRRTTLRGASISGGDLTVKGGGNLVLRDGGDVLVEDGGHVTTQSPGETRWRDEDGDIRASWGTGVEPVTGKRLQAINYFDKNFNGRVNLGEIVNFTDNTVQHGVLVEDEDDIDLLVSHELEMWHGLPDGSGFGSNVEFPGEYYWSQPGTGHQGLYLNISTNNTHLLGGADGSGQFGCRVILRGDSDFEVRFRDGANSSYIDIAASDFIVRSSSVSTKEITGTPGPALPTVIDTQIHKFRHRNSPTDKERIGPMAEDLPPGLADWTDPDGGVNLTAAVWTLWQAVQEQQEQIDQLKSGA